MPTPPDGGTLALDLNGAARRNSAIGWAYGPLEWKLPTSGFLTLPTIGGRGHRYVAFVDWINNEVMDRWKPANVCIENPLPPNIPNTNADTMRQIYAMVAFVEEAAARASVPFSGEHVDTMRVNVTGRCRWPPRFEGDKDATKAGVQEFIRSLGLDIKNHDECDAIVAWLNRRQQILGLPPARHTLFRYGMA